jgi:hypothetical protein
VWSKVLEFVKRR